MPPLTWATSALLIGASAVISSVAFFGRCPACPSCPAISCGSLTCSGQAQTNHSHFNLHLVVAVIAVIGVLACGFKIGHFYESVNVVTGRPVVESPRSSVASVAGDSSIATSGESVLDFQSFAREQAAQLRKRRACQALASGL